ncbi:MAG: cytochrome P450 [Ilumatobacter sp.]|nr:cytochrome P450 [Ilumatobacter sp.]
MTATIPRPPRRVQVRLLRQLLDTPQRALDEIDGSYGPIVALGAGPLRSVVVGSPPLIRDLLMQPNDRFRADTPLSPFPFVVGKTTMIASDGADHRRRRGSVQHAFGRRRLNRWIPMIVERTDAAIDELFAVEGESAPLDLYPVGRRLLIEIVVRALFGERLVDRTAEIDANFERIQRYLSSPLYRQIPHPIPFTFRAAVRRDRIALDALIDTAIAASRRQPPVTDTDEGGDVLDVLIHRSDLSDAEIRDQVKTLIGAGYDTTASSLAWILWEATTHRDLWQKLREEADRVLAPGAPDEQTLQALDLAHRTVRESLRLHPASGVGVRQTAIDITVGSYPIPNRSLVLWSPYLAGRDPAAWPEPDVFDPDRFLALDDAQRALADDAWVPFGRGPRMCVGFALAQMELTLILARLAQRLDLTPTADHPPKPVGLVVGQPAGGAPMHVRRRSSGVMATESPPPSTRSGR